MCPKAWLADVASEEAWLYSNARRYLWRNILPDAGGWLDQSPRFIEAVGIVADEAEKARKAKQVEEGGAGQKFNGQRRDPRQVIGRP